MTMLATLTSKGQVTLPAPIRAALKLEAGARLDFVLQDDGSIRVVPVSRDPLAVSAVLPKPPRGPASEAEIRAAIAGRAAGRFARSGS
jgi:antitoxin PrlF